MPRPFLDPLNPKIAFTPPIELDPPNSYRAYRDLLLRAHMPSQPSGYVDDRPAALSAGPVSSRPAEVEPSAPAIRTSVDIAQAGPAEQAPMEIATGAFRREPDPQAAAIIESMIRSGATDDEIYDELKRANAGATRLKRDQTKKARETLKANPNYKGRLADAVRDVPQTGWNRFVGSPTGAFGMGYFNGAEAGLLDETAGAIDSAVMGRNIHEAIADYDAKKQALARANPWASTLGNIAGGMAGSAKFGKLADGLLEGTRLATRLGKITPWVGDVALGGLSGAGDSNENRVGGALIGATLGVGGRAAGELAAIPIGALARSRPASRVVDLARKAIGADPLARPTLPDPTALRPKRAMGLFGGAAAGASLPYVLPDVMSYVPEWPLRRERSMGLPKHR